MSKELLCKLCKTNKVRVSDHAEAATCSDCINKALIESEKVVAKKSILPKKKSDRYKFRSEQKKGYWSKLIDPELLVNKSTDEIVEMLTNKQPESDKARLRQLVYIRRGALKSSGQLNTDEEKVNGATTSN